MIRKIPANLVQILFLGFGKVAFLLVFVLLFKALSLIEAGVFSIAYAVAVILATTSECGLRGLLVRELARSSDSPEASKHILAGTLQSRLFTLLPYLALGFIAGLLFLPGDQWAILVLLLVAAWFDSNAFVFRGALRAYDFIILDALLAGSARIVLLAITGLFYWQDQLTLLNFAILFALVACADTLAALMFIVIKTRIQLTLAGSFRKTIAFVKRGIPFIILNVIGILYIRVGVLMLGVFHSGAGLDDAAAMSLSAKIPEGVTFLPIALMNAAIPFFARNGKNLDVITPVFRKLEIVVGSAGIIVSAGLVIFAEQLILLFATPDYLPYKSVFQIYGIATFFSFLQYVYANLLICMDQEKRVARRYAIVLVLNVLISLILVWRYKALGAAIALLTCEIISLIIDMRYLKKCGIHPKSSLLLKWFGLAALCVLLGGAANYLPNPWNLAVYWMAGGIIGAVVLLKSQLSQHSFASR